MKAAQAGAGHGYVLIVLLNGQARRKGLQGKAAKGNCSKCKKHFKAIFRGRHSSSICQAAHVISHSMFDPALEVWEGAGEEGGEEKKNLDQLPEMEILHLWRGTNILSM